MRSRVLLFSLLGIPLACILLVGIYYIPPVHSRLAWRVESLWVQARRIFTPAEKVVFIPQQQEVNSIVQATLTSLAVSTAAKPTTTPTMESLQASATPISPQPSSTPLPSATPTATLLPLPPSAMLEGIRYQAQSFNNCGPANLAMALSFWGWQGDQNTTRVYLRPNAPKVDDKNIMPAEMAAFVQSQTDLEAITRVAGDLDTLKRFLAAGFPVILEKGHDPPDNWWMGHYMVVNGYDDAKQRFIAQDSLLQANYPLAYDDVMPWWRDFNYVYIVIYSPEKQAEVLAILRSQADETANYQYAAERARREIETLAGRDLYFAWFNLGTSLVALKDYAGAAAAYDQAFAINANLPDDDRLYRMLWYQTGPYEAYYHTGRLQDLADLGNATLAWVGQPVLEETYYWLGMAREAQGDLEKAVYDYKKAVDINPLSTPAQQALQRLGITYP